MPSPTLEALSISLQAKLELLTVLDVELVAYLELKQERHDQLTRRYERLERQMESMTDSDTPRNRRLLADYEHLSELHAQREEELDDLENLILEPLREARDGLLRLVS